MRMEQKVVLKMRGISKFYPGVVALDKVDLDVLEGEVHALLGENGAGKSTLIKVLSGAVKNDEGTIEINGKTFEHMTPLESRENGVEVIYQEYNLIPGLTVAENVCLGSQMHGIVDMRQQVAKTKEMGVSEGYYLRFIQFRFNAIGLSLLAYVAAASDISLHWLLGLDESMTLLAKNGRTETIMAYFCLLPDDRKNIVMEAVSHI